MVKESILALALLYGSVSVQAGDGLLRADFNNGIPVGFELINNNGLAVRQADFRKLSPKDTWFTGNVFGADGTAAISVSRRLPVDGTTDNWLVLPLLHIANENCWLQWKARSMHHDLLDSYSVMVSVGDMTDFQPLCDVESESYGWNSRVQSLSAYIGRDIYIAFRHNSTNKFALAIDDVFVGEPAEYAVMGCNDNPHFIGKDEAAELSFEVENVGKTLQLKHVLLVVDGNETYKRSVENNIMTGEILSVTYKFPVEVNKSYAYTLQLETIDGEIVDVLSDFLTCSYYPRTMLVEKFTGVWCNNCPAAIPFINKMKDRFGSDVAVVEVHGYNKQVDPMSCDQYGASLPANQLGYPTVAFNRDWSKAQNTDFKSMDNLEEIMKIPAVAMVKATACFTEDGLIEVNAQSQFASDLDNSSDRYRIGVIIKEKQLGKEAENYMQANNCTLLADEEYAYMPVSLTGNVVSFHDIARGCDTEEEVKASGVVNGVKETLPTEIKAFTDYDTTLKLAVPATVLDRKELELVVVLFNNTNVMNVAVVEEIAGAQSLENEAVNDGIQFVSIGEAKKVLFPLFAPYAVSVFALDGGCVYSFDGNGQECFIDAALESGCYLVRASQKGKTICNKFIVK